MLKIRRAGIADSAGIAQVQVTNYQVSYAELFAKHYLDDFTVEEQTHDWQDLFTKQPSEVVFVADLDGKIVGYALARAESREMPGYDSELVAFHVLPEYQKRGIGSRLFLETARHLQATGCCSLMLWTLKQNPVRHFYAALGGELRGHKEYEIDADRMTEVAYGWSQLETLIESLERKIKSGV
jgi:ribosomal protein S18 acetylase RimI-like enzyme